MIRTFLALPLPEDITRRLLLVQARLPLQRPVPPENLHITLVFLDSQPESVLAEVDLALGSARLPVPTLALAGIGGFGAGPETVHALITPDAGLLALQSKVATLVRRLGVVLPARRYVPHVTLARGPQDGAALARALAMIAPLSSQPWRASEVILYRSTLLKQGPAYDPLAQYPLIP